MVQVAGKLAELSAGSLLLPLLFVLRQFSVVVLQVASHLLILRLHVLEVSLAGVEVMLILARVKAPIAAIKIITS